MRTKLYLISSGVAITLLFFSLWQIKPVNININDFLGLVSHFTVFYWIGLTIILTCSIMIYLDVKIKNTALLIFTLIIVGFFLFGPRIFAENNPVPTSNYWLGAGYESSINNQPLNLASPNVQSNYSAWPGYDIITANLLSISGIDYDNLMKYMTIFWIISCAIIPFAIGKRLGLSHSSSFLISFMSLSSFWVIQNYYSPQMLGYIFYLLIFMLVITFKSRMAEYISITLLFVALVLTHGLTPIAVLLGILALGLLQKTARFIWLFSVIFIFWLVFLAPPVFNLGIKTFWNELIHVDFFTFLGSPGYAQVSSFSGEIGKYCRAFYPIVLALLIAFAFVFYLRKKISNENRNVYIICFAWATGLVLLLFSTGWNIEMDWRLYMFLLVPVSTIIVLTYSNKYLFIVLLTTFLIFNIPADYHTEAIQQTLNSALSGAQFFAVNINETSTCFLTNDSGINSYAEYYNPDMLNYDWLSIESTNSNKLDLQIATDAVLQKCNYLILSETVDTMYQYEYGFNPINQWLHSNSTSLIYNNGHFQIYANGFQ